MSENDLVLPPEPGESPDPWHGLSDDEAGNPSLEPPAVTGDEDDEDDGDDLDEEE